MGNSKRALVTGGSRGIGEAIARRLAVEGLDVVVTGRDRAKLEQVATAVGGAFIVCDLAEESAQDALLSEVGAVDVLVNNAGLAKSAPLAKVEDADWDYMMAINARAPFRLCRALAPAMVERGWGRIINIASNAGLCGYRYSAVYCASKHALVGLTRALAVDLAKTGVTINAVCPGWTDTDLATEAVERIARKTGRSREEARGALAQMTPQNRMIEPDEVAHLVASLVAEEARGVHGQSLVVDGGQFMN